MGDPLHARMEADSPKRTERPKTKRREKALPLEVELDSSREFAMQNISRSSLGNTKEAHLVVLDDFEQKEDVKLYSQLPDYDDFRGYDLSADEQLERAASPILLTSINLHGEL